MTVLVKIDGEVMGHVSYFGYGSYVPTVEGVPSKPLETALLRMADALEQIPKGSNTLFVKLEGDDEGAYMTVRGRGSLAAKREWARDRYGDDIEFFLNDLKDTVEIKVDLDRDYGLSTEERLRKCTDGDATFEEMFGGDVLQDAPELLKEDDENRDVLSLLNDDGTIG